jgi:hypothetical protein
MASSLGAVAMMCSFTSRPLNGRGSPASAKGIALLSMSPRGEKGWKRQGSAWSRWQPYQFSRPDVSVSCSTSKVIRRQIADPE